VWIGGVADLHCEVFTFERDVYQGICIRNVAYFVIDSPPPTASCTFHRFFLTAPRQQSRIVCSQQRDDSEASKKSARRSATPRSRAFSLRRCDSFCLKRLLFVVVGCWGTICLSVSSGSGHAPLPLGRSRGAFDTSRVLTKGPSSPQPRYFSQQQFSAKKQEVRVYDLYCFEFTQNPTLRARVRRHLREAIKWTQSGTSLFLGKLS
jgi:hypothetical protein